MTNRKRLPNRRSSISFNFEHDGMQYRCTASRYASGGLAEVFLGCNKVGSSAQAHADTAAVLASLLLQTGMPAADIAKAVAGSAIAAALELAEAP